MVGIGRAGYRIGQFGRGLVPWGAARDRALAVAILDTRQLAAFRLMAPADQRHAARVARLVLAAGGRDPDLLVAALLHDLGKVDPQGKERVRTAHRVANVLLPRLVPELWEWASGMPLRGPLHGCYLLRHHPALGAAWAAALGVSPRAQALIAAHQSGSVPADTADALRRLREADDRA